MTKWHKGRSQSKAIRWLRSLCIAPPYGSREIPSDYIAQEDPWFKQDNKFDSDDHRTVKGYKQGYKYINGPLVLRATKEIRDVYHAGKPVLGSKFLVKVKKIVYKILSFPCCCLHKISFPL